MSDLLKLIALIDRGIRLSTPEPSRMNAHLYDECFCGGHKAKVSYECQACHSNP